MIALRKLKTLAPSTRRRKSILLIRHFEVEALLNQNFDGLYLSELLTTISEDRFWPSEICALSKSIHTMLHLRMPASLGRKLHALRHGMLTAMGTDWADWDTVSPADAILEKRQPDCTVFPFRIYLDGLRSPFNVGSIARTALAFGVERLWISPECTPLNHQRARRSAMGATERIQWDTIALDSLSQSDTGPVFALELGGVPLSAFAFPSSGTVILGSEELGVSPDLLHRAASDAGIVSIPLYGPKASINVGVAFGILLQHWAEQTKHPP